MQAVETGEQTDQESGSDLKIDRWEMGFKMVGKQMRCES